METFEQLCQHRRSIRKYNSRPVEQEKIDYMLRCALMAPSSKRTNPWEFIVVRDESKLRAMAGCRTYGSQMFETAMAAIVLALDTSLSDAWMADGAIAAEHLLLAAEAMGLGAVWTACYPYEDRMNPAREVLNIPETVCPYAIVPVGHPDGETPVKNKWDPENIHYNRW